MLKVTKLMTILFFCMALSACANLDVEKKHGNIKAQWDFDHSVQFTQTTLEKNYYQLEIIPNNKVNFERLVTFLLRKSYNLCHHYHYKLEIVQGIERFDDKLAMPNYSFPSLIAKVECQQ